MLGIDREKKQPSGLNVYGYQNSTSPGVALAAAEIARTGNGLTAEVDLPVWQQNQVLSGMEEDLNLASLFGEGERTGSASVAVRTFVESRLTERLSSRIENFPSIEGQIATIRSALSLQMKELAEVIGVERPTVYSWLNGNNSPQPTNRDRLHTVYRLARRWNDRSNTPVGKDRHLPDDDGCTLFDLLRGPTIQVGKIIERLDALAETAARAAAKDKTSIRELARKHGIDLTRVRDAWDDIDLETGKRIDPE